MGLNRVFLVGVGDLPSSEMRRGCMALSESWGGTLSSYSCVNDPRQVLESLPTEDGLIQLDGDAAMYRYDKGSWLEALGAWRQPIILLVVPNSSGDISGFASSYAALCSSLGVPLVGLVQVGGPWNLLDRKSDALPWCGWIPSQNQDDLTLGGNPNQKDKINTEEIIFILRKRIKELNF